MSVGLPTLLELYGPAVVRSVTVTGRLRPEHSNGHLAMRMYRWRELRALLEPHGLVVAASAAGTFREAGTHDSELLTELELDFGAEPGALDLGRHIIAVLATGDSNQVAAEGGNLVAD